VPEVGRTKPRKPLKRLDVSSRPFVPCQVDSPADHIQPDPGLKFSKAAKPVIVSTPGTGTFRAAARRRVRLQRGPTHPRRHLRQ
jgi:hypothetical protein